MLGFFSWMRRDSCDEYPEKLEKPQMPMNATIESCSSVLSEVDLVDDTCARRDSQKRKLKESIRSSSDFRKQRKAIRCRAAKQKKMKGELNSIMTERCKCPKRNSLKKFMLGGGDRSPQKESDAEVVKRLLALYNMEDDEALHQEAVLLSIQNPNQKKPSDNSTDRNEFAQDYEQEYRLDNAHGWATLTGSRPLPKAVDKLKTHLDFDSPLFDITPVYRPSPWTSTISICSPSYSIGARSKTAAELKKFKDIAFTFNDTPDSAATQYYSPIEDVIDENVFSTSLPRKFKNILLSQKKKTSFSPMSPVKKIASVLKDANCLSPIIFKEKKDKSFVF
ncbi:unnamed protein product [Auanema sp. JU1783]|nr:unnamed protein product [Auanema sp. JU1783]